MFAIQRQIVQRATLPSFCADRPQIVQYLEAVSRDWNLKISTFVLGLRLFDEVCSEINFKRDELTLIAMQALSMAAKLEEHPGVFPLTILTEVFSSKFSVPQIIFTEQVIFKLLNFKLRRETILDFLHFYLSRGVIMVAEMASHLPDQHQKIIQACERMAIQLTVQAAKKFEAGAFEPSTVAAAVVWRSRNIAGLAGWPMALNLMTRASKKNFN